jgi:hypothetical protein
MPLDFSSTTARLAAVARMPKSKHFEIIELARNGALGDTFQRLCTPETDTALSPFIRPRVAIPRIDEVWPDQGGIYAGVVAGRDGAPDYHLIAGPENEDTLDHAAASKWAAGLTVDGHSDFALPFRKEQAILFGNAAQLFKPEWYWSCEQRASSSRNAWDQSFDDGSQNGWHEGSSIRARAVRRLTI